MLQNQEALRSIPNTLISRILKGEFKDGTKDLRRLSEAVQVLDRLGDAPSKNDNVCKAIKKHQSEWLSETSSSVLYHYAETAKAYKCQGISSKIDDYLTSINLKAQTDANELYFAYLLNQNAKAYEASSNDKLKQQFVDLAKNDLLNKFNSKDWTYNGASSLSLESLRIASLLASIARENKDLTDLNEYISNAAGKLLKQGVTDESGEFYILTTAVTQKDTWLGSEDVNFHLLHVINAVGSPELTATQRLGLRNYFLNRALLAQCNHILLNSLKGLKILSDIPNLKLDNSLVSLGSSKQQISLQLVDNFGNPFKGAKNVAVAFASLTEPSAEVRDLTKSTKFNKDNNEGSVTLNENEIGKYRLQVTVDSVTQEKIFSVTDRLRVQSVSYLVSQVKKFPAEFTTSVLHPNKIDSIGSATNDNYIHMQVSASF